MALPISRQAGLAARNSRAAFERSRLLDIVHDHEAAGAHEARRHLQIEKCVFVVVVAVDQQQVEGLAFQNHPGKEIHRTPSRGTAHGVVALPAIAR